MLHRSNMPTFLVVVWMVLDVALWIGGTLLVGAGETLEFFLMPFVWGQFIALTGWAAMGGSNIDSSLFASLALPFIFGLAIDSNEHAGHFGFTIPVMLIALGYGFTLNLPLLILRVVGSRFELDQERRAGEPPAYQISLRQIMLYTLLVAIVTAAWSQALTCAAEQGSFAGSEIILAVIAALLIPWSIWVCFCAFDPLHSGITATLVTGLWGAMLKLIEPDAALPFSLAPAVILIVHLLALQAAGFRFR